MANKYLLSLNTGASYQLGGERFANGWLGQH